ncbi:MAG: septum formation initiator family protein [Bacillota bacterium]|nr:septum formation initiator family protein [Bacillota bacterium]
MLQAEAKIYSSVTAPVYKEQQQVRQVKRTYKKINYKRKIILVAGSILFVYSLLLVFLCIKSATLSYQINTLQKEIDELGTTQNRIEFQISQAQSLEKIEQLARNNLGMVKPEMGSSIMMEYQSKPVQLAETKDEINNRVSQRPLEKLYTNLSRLAQKTKQ